MALYLVVKAGPSQGETVAISDGLVIGRRGTGIRLDDPKVSSEHARVRATPEGLFELLDLASKNGTFQNGAQVDRILLKPGTEFEIGRTLFTVIEGSTTSPEPSPAQKTRKKKWNEVLSSFLRKSLFNVENSPVKLEPMRPALVLDFLKGPQAETRWILGYGPRKVGRLSVDLPIFELEASEICFEIFPSPEGVQFKAVGKEVRLNGKKVSSEVLKVGDRIQIHGTELEVDFTE